MRLITEQNNDIEVLTEDKDGKKATYIKGIFLQTEITNRNGRMYRFDTLNREVSKYCLLYTSPSPRDRTRSRMPSSA